ncbi:MAG TPA: peptidoglycan DD-metalloendopeptidase family protein [Candidatus Paceibacterota bacterium]|nr:peptidoglycan DD-metalloendopeptidase family protein [Candidatus Paceibacterota bacterium]
MILSLSLLSGAIFVPLQARANFLTLFFGDQALADVPSLSGDTNNSLNSIKNSQTMDLLQASVSSASVFQDPKPKSTSSAASKKDVQDNTVDPNANVNIVSDNAILPATGPLGVSDGKTAPDPSSFETSVYVVRKDDSLSAIANMFSVSVNTILWANNMKKGDKLVEGDVLLILPVSGLEITVTKGQTLQSIAKLYKADINDILQSNNITLDTPLALGDTLIIPNGLKSEESNKPIAEKDLPASIAKDKQYYEQHPVQNLAGYFIDPVPGYRLSQGIHDNNAVDLAISKGTPIHAAAAGRIVLARKGYNGGFGNVVIIAHPNGTETLYAHQSKIAAHTGDEVFQGEVIGYVGSTGRSSGPHLHFEVHGARNPGADGSWKY